MHPLDLLHSFSNEFIHPWRCQKASHLGKKWEKSQPWNTLMTRVPGNFLDKNFLRDCLSLSIYFQKLTGSLQFNFWAELHWRERKTWTMKKLFFSFSSPGTLFLSSASFQAVSEKVKVKAAECRKEPCICYPNQPATQARGRWARLMNLS